jgi:hypothetical protein
MAGDFLQQSRHGTTYFFRRRGPQDMQHILKITQVYRSLATQDRREAIVRARVLSNITGVCIGKSPLRRTVRRSE